MEMKNFQSGFRHIKKLIFSSIIIIILCSPSAQGDIDPLLAARLQHTIDSVRSHYNYKGVSAAVYIPSKGSWNGTSGFSHGHVQIAPGMKFAIASNTKTFISVLMLKLQEMNILSLNDSLHKWIPSFQHVDSNITIRQLLNHTSGLFNYTTYPGFGNAMASDTGRFWTPEELLTNFMNPPYFNPGEGFQYSNTNYILAGMIIKAATGNSVSSKLRELVLNPANLNDTYLPHEESIPAPIAHGWQSGFEIKYPSTSGWSSAWTSGAMFSTAENMVRFYRELFDIQIINQSSLKQMLTFPQQPIGIYALGIGLGLFGGRQMFFHGGGIAGYTSITVIDTTKKFIISVLVNQSPGGPENFITPISKAILEHPITGIGNPEISVPAEYSLSQNYPNPFNPSTSIMYSIGSTAYVTLKIYDVLGNEIAALVDEEKPAGTYEATWNSEPGSLGISSGVYFYQLKAGSFTEIKKMILLR